MARFASSKTKQKMLLRSLATYRDIARGDETHTLISGLQPVVSNHVGVLQSESLFVHVYVPAVERTTR